MRRALGIAALCVIAACVETQPQQVEFCEFARTLPARASVVRMNALVVVTQHGSYLTDERCPDETIGWRDSNQFENTAEFESLSNSRDQIMFGVDPRGPLAISVDIEGQVRNPIQNPTLAVFRVHSFTVVPMGAELLRPPSE